jgi:hypothetical protein
VQLQRLEVFVYLLSHDEIRAFFSSVYNYVVSDTKILGRWRSKLVGDMEEERGGAMEHRI